MVYGQTSSRFGIVACERHAATENNDDRLERWIDRPKDGCSGNNRAERSHESVKPVPKAVNPGHLVRKKLGCERYGGHHHHDGVRKHSNVRPELRGQLKLAISETKTEHQDHRIQSDSSDEPGTHG